MKIRCINAADRDALVVILAKNGYTVRQGKSKLSPGDAKATSYVELVEREDIIHVDRKPGADGPV